VVARLSDAGWGERLSELLDSSNDGVIPPSITEGANRVLADWLATGCPHPSAIVVVPSRKRPHLLASFAEGIARQLGLPLLGTLEANHTTTGGGRANSPRRVAALHAAFSTPPLIAAQCGELAGPILLLDDTIDSGWTMTLAARALRIAGANEVMPFALASTGRRD
jgi:ATP-dependent DNA helicase RecQ